MESVSRTIQELLASRIVHRNLQTYAEKRKRKRLSLDYSWFFFTWFCYAEPHMFYTALMVPLSAEISQKPSDDGADYRVEFKFDKSVSQRWHEIRLVRCYTFINITRILGGSNFSSSYLSTTSYWSFGFIRKLHSCSGWNGIRYFFTELSYRRL